MGYLPKNQQGVNPKGKDVTVEFSITVAQATDKFPSKAFINIRSVELKPAESSKVEEQDLVAGWGAGA